jgi:hypothetical protein
MSLLRYYGHSSIRKDNEIIIYTLDKDRLKPKGVIIKVLMNNLTLRFANFEDFKKIGSKFAKFNSLNIPISPDDLCDLIEGIFDKDDGDTSFGNYMYMFTEGIDYVVIFRLSHQIYGSPLSFLQEGLNPDKDYIFIVKRSILIEQKP